MTRTVSAQAAKRMFVDAQPNPEQLTLEELRRNDDALFGSFLPDDAVVEPVDAGGVPSLWVSVPGAAADRTVVFFHGGGYIIGSARGRAAVAAEISRAGDCRVLVPDYRLAPEHPYPAAVDDAVACYRWLTRAVDARSVVVSGDSAGGGLALALLLAARDHGLTLPAGAAPMSPIVDLTLTGETWETHAHLDPIVTKGMVTGVVQQYLKDADPLNPYASPLRGDLAGLPPLLVLVGSEEALLSDARALTDRARAAATPAELHVFEGMFHIWPLFSTVLPEGREAIDLIARFIQDRADPTDGRLANAQAVDEQADRAAEPT